MRLKVNLGPFSFEKGIFVPAKGNAYIEEENPRVSYGAGVYSGLIIIGLSGKDGESFQMRDVVEFVKDARTRQSGDPGSSFILQKGIYKHKTSGQVVEEDSVRVIVLHLTDETRDVFKENILTIAEGMQAAFNQESVIVEFQNKGVTDEVVSIE